LTLLILATVSKHFSVLNFGRIVAAGQSLENRTGETP